MQLLAINHQLNSGWYQQYRTEQCKRCVNLLDKMYVLQREAMFLALKLISKKLTFGCSSSLQVVAVVVLVTG